MSAALEVEPFSPWRSSAPEVHCSECGTVERAHFSPPTGTAMVELGLCFLCLYWTQKIATREHPGSVFVSGRAYVVGEENAPRYERGNGGRRFVVRFHDGRVLDTRNLWSNGGVPERFRSRLPDNAVFEVAHGE